MALAVEVIEIAKEIAEDDARPIRQRGPNDVTATLLAKEAAGKTALKMEGESKLSVAGFTTIREYSSS